MYERPAETLRENWFPPGTTFRAVLFHYLPIYDYVSVYMQVPI